jgi:hypothetical protein
LSMPPGEVAVAGRVVVEEDGSDGEPDGAWTIRVRASCGESRDGSNELGVKRGAAVEWDRFDRSEAPMSPGEAISLYFPHAEWGRHPDRYAVDIRGYEQETEASAPPTETGTSEVWGYTWSFDVAKNFSKGTAGDEVVLEFSGVEGIVGEAEVLLIDGTLERVIDLRKEDRYVFYHGKRGCVTRDDDARFTLLVGSEEYVDSHQDELPSVPTQTVLHQNHPNPFNPTTIIRYELATAGRVSVKVYDVSGALVKTLEDRDRAPGRYEVGWDGENERGERVSSGVYFYVLETPSVRLTKKMVCIK